MTTMASGNKYRIPLVASNVNKIGNGYFPEPQAVDNEAFEQNEEIDNALGLEDEADDLESQGQEQGQHVQGGGLEDEEDDLESQGQEQGQGQGQGLEDEDDLESQGQGQDDDSPMLFYLTIPTRCFKTPCEKFYDFSNTVGSPIYRALLVIFTTILCYLVVATSDGGINNGYKVDGKLRSRIRLYLQYVPFVGMHNATDFLDFAAIRLVVAIYKRPEKLNGLWDKFFDYVKNVKLKDSKTFKVANRWHNSLPNLKSFSAYSEIFMTYMGRRDPSTIAGILYESFGEEKTTPNDGEQRTAMDLSFIFSSVNGFAKKQLEIMNFPRQMMNVDDDIEDIEKHRVFKHPHLCFEVDVQGAIQYPYLFEHFCLPLTSTWRQLEKYSSVNEGAQTFSMVLEMQSIDPTEHEKTGRDWSEFVQYFVERQRSLSENQQLSTFTRELGLIRFKDLIFRSRNGGMQPDLCKFLTDVVAMEGSVFEPIPPLKLCYGKNHKSNLLVLSEYLFSCFTEVLNVNSTHIMVFLGICSVLDSFRYDFQMKLNLLFCGGPGKGKSFILDILNECFERSKKSGDNTVASYASHGDENFFCFLFDEAAKFIQGDQLDKKKMGGTDNPGDPQTKSMLSECRINKDRNIGSTGDKSSAYGKHIVEKEINSSWTMATNVSLHTLPGPIRARFFNIYCAFDPQKFEKGARRTTLHDLTKESKPKCIENDFKRLLRFLERNMFVIEMVIACKLMDDVDMGRFSIIFDACKTYMKSMGMYRNDNLERDEQLLGALARKITLINSIVHFFNDNGAIGYEKEWSLDLIQKISPFLYCTDEVAFFSVSCLAKTYMGEDVHLLVPLLMNFLHSIGQGSVSGLSGGKFFIVQKENGVDVYKYSTSGAFIEYTVSMKHQKSCPWNQFTDMLKMCDQIRNCFGKDLLAYVVENAKRHMYRNMRLTPIQRGSPLPILTVTHGENPLNIKVKILESYARQYIRRLAGDPYAMDNPMYSIFSVEDETIEMIHAVSTDFKCEFDRRNLATPFLKSIRKGRKLTSYKLQRTAQPYSDFVEEGENDAQEQLEHENPDIESIQRDYAIFLDEEDDEDDDDEIQADNIRKRQMEYEEYHFEKRRKPNDGNLTLKQLYGFV